MCHQGRSAQKGTEWAAAQALSPRPLTAAVPRVSALRDGPPHNGRSDRLC